MQEKNQIRFVLLTHEEFAKLSTDEQRGVVFAPQPPGPTHALQ